MSGLQENMYPLQPYKPFTPKILSRRPPQKLNSTERRILNFFAKKAEEGIDYHTYSRDPELLKAIRKSYSQASRALRNLASWKILECSSEKKMQGAPVIYWVDPERLWYLKEVMRNNFYITASLVMRYVQSRHGWFTSSDVAQYFKVSKRHAQKLLKILVERDKLIRFHLKGRGFRGRVIYTEKRGQLPLTHFRSESIIQQLKKEVYQTDNPFL